MVTICWIFFFWRFFYSLEQVKFGVSEHLHDNAWGNGLKCCMLMYPYHHQNWLDYGHGMLNFSFLALFWLSETDRIWIFLAFAEECLRGMAWHVAYWCILTTFKTEVIMIMVCWISSFWRIFDLVKQVKFVVSGPLRQIVWGEWPEILHADVFWPTSELIRIWSWSVDFPPFGATLTYRNWSNLGFPGIIWRMRGG